MCSRKGYIVASGMWNADLTILSPTHYTPPRHEGTHAQWKVRGEAQLNNLLPEFRSEFRCTCHCSGEISLIRRWLCSLGNLPHFLNNNLPNIFCGFWLSFRWFFLVCYLLCHIRSGHWRIFPPLKLCNFYSCFLLVQIQGLKSCFKVNQPDRSWDHLL